MASSTEMVALNLSLYQPNQLIIASDLYRSVSDRVTEAAFYKTLERFCDAGSLVHLAKGIYYRPKASRFGTVPISENEIANFYLRNGTGIVVGYRLYNKKGLTTQIGKRMEILSTSLKEERKNIRNVSIRRIPVRLEKETIPIIETLEILQAYNSIEDTLKLPSGQEVPSSILYVDEYGGGTTYLPIRWLTENLGIPFAWDSESGTLEIGKGYTMTDPDEFLQELANEWLVDGDYPKNANGETYGPESIASIVGHMPDLIAAAASNGEEGYIRKSELDEYRSIHNPQYNSIPVYDLDGNVIGEFQFVNG